MKLRCYLRSAFLLIFLGQAAPYTWRDDAQTIRFTVIDLEVRLQPLQTPLQGRTLDNFIVSLRVFLESALNVKPTTVYNLQVAVGGQTLGILPENGEDISFQSSKDHWITVDLQVLIEYEIEAEFAATGESDMEGRIRALFQDQWSDLLVVLQLLDRPVFNDIENIALETKTTPDDSRLGPTVSSVNPEVVNEHPTLSLIVILVVVGVGLVVSLTIAVPLFLMSKRDIARSSVPRPQHYRTRTLTTSGSPDGEATPSLHEEEVTDSFSTDLGLPRPSKGHVQRVYSEDKVLPLVIGGLALQKVHSAEEKLQRTLSDLRQSVFRERELGKGKSGVGSITPVHSKHKDATKQTPNKMEEEAKSRSKKKEKPSKGALTMEAGGDGVVVKQIYIARDDQHSKSNHSVSTLTGGLRNSMDEEEEDNESLTFRVDSIKLARSTQFTTTIDKDCQSVISTDDFGSIAASMPDANAKFQTRIVI